MAQEPMANLNNNLDEKLANILDEFDQILQKYLGNEAEIIEVKFRSQKDEATQPESSNVIPVLETVLNDPNSEVRFHAAYTLCKKGLPNPSAVSILSEELRNQNSRFRVEAVEALRAIELRELPNERRAASRCSCETDCEAEGGTMENYNGKRCCVVSKDSKDPKKPKDIIVCCCGRST